MSAIVLSMLRSCNFLNGASALQHIMKPPYLPSLLSPPGRNSASLSTRISMPVFPVRITAASRSTVSMKKTGPRKDAVIYELKF
ncbi:MAG: hypothetical protein LBH57_06530 [Treponema sp.]|nr:hypothetical protein [Treponema sp.]